MERRGSADDRDDEYTGDCEWMPAVAAESVNVSGRRACTDPEEATVKRWLVKQTWPTGDKRRCRRCANGGTVQGHRNGYAVVWKCECGAKTAIRYAQSSKHYKDGDIEECLMAVGDEEPTYLHSSRGKLLPSTTLPRTKSTHQYHQQETRQQQRRLRRRRDRQVGLDVH